MGDPLNCRRDQFSLPAGAHYLNCGYMAPLPRVVEEAGAEGMAGKRFPAGILAADFFEKSDQLRERFARLVGVSDPNRIAILPAASYGIAAVARNSPIESDQNIVLLHEQFPGNVYAWRRRAAEVGAEIRTIRPPDGGPDGGMWNERILEAIDSGTAIVALPHAHWTDGTRFDLAAIGARAREVGAVFIVDGTQSVGAMPFDVAELRPDALVVAGYKWLMGPYSLGFGYFGPRFDEGVPLEETWIGREGSEDFQGLVDYHDDYQPGAIRYDVGERSNFILVPMQLAALELILDWKPERISDYCRRITAELFDEAPSLGFAVEEERWRSPHLFGLRMPAGLELSALKQALEDRQIYVSLRGSALRVSPNVYNDEEDIEALIEALRQARG